MSSLTITEIPSQSLERFKEYDHHVKVVRFTNEDVGLRGFISIHRVRNNAAIGGTRLWPYPNEEEALQDVLRLSRAMTYKCAMADIALGGGKGVIILPSHFPLGREAFMGAYGELLETMKGFYTGEDVGVTQDDVAAMAKQSSFLVGKPGVGGDPGPWAALSVYHSIRAALGEVYGTTDVKGHTFAIKGLGKVGAGAAQLLARDGGVIFAADVNENAISKARQEVPGIQIVPVNTIHALAVDVYVPCALGGELTEEKIKELHCRIVCGGANNQLATPDADRLLAERGIWYVPDYIANAGGLMNVAAELDPRGYHEEHVAAHVEGIAETVRNVFRLSRESQKTPSRVANELAESIFTEGPAVLSA